MCDWSAPTRASGPLIFRWLMDLRVIETTGAKMTWRKQTRMTSFMDIVSCVISFFFNYARLMLCVLHASWVLRLFLSVKFIQDAADEWARTLDQVGPGCLRRNSACFLAYHVSFLPLKRARLSAGQLPIITDEHGPKLQKRREKTTSEATINILIRKKLVLVAIKLST